MNQDAIKEIAEQLGVGANYLAEHLTDFAPQWGMFKAIQDFAGALLMGIILAAIAFGIRKDENEGGDKAWGHDKTLVVSMFVIFALVALFVFGCFAVDGITHLVIPQAAMINDMLEMVQNG